MASALDIAAYLLRLQCGEDGSATCDTMKLQKLTYYSQGWFLAWKGEPLFEDRIEAWANGPVVRTLYERHRRRYSLGLSAVSSIGDPDKLSPEESRLVQAVSRSYGKLSGTQLSQMTHMETPWMNARKRAKVDDGERSEELIEIDDIREYFLSQAPPRQAT